MDSVYLSSGTDNLRSEDLVEVLPEHRGHNIGSQIVRALLERLGTCYMIDLVCDDDVAPFYEQLGGTRLNAVAWRNHDRLHVNNE